MIIAVDFDGTVVRHAYPLVGAELPLCVQTLKELVAAGHSLILFTMRHEKELQDAVDWYAKHEIPLWGINENPIQKDWTTSPKPYAHILIDDTALGCPLVFPEDDSRPHVNWAEVRRMTLKIRRKVEP